NHWRIAILCQKPDSALRRPVLVPLGYRPRRLGEQPYTLVDLVRSHRRVGQPYRVVTALEQEVAALDHGHAAGRRLGYQQVDLDVLGQLDPEEVAAVRLDEPRV